jgi:dTDP-4-dehydrorhamnose reductase
MRHLVIGASGQVGEHLLRTLHQSGEEAVGTYRQQVGHELIRLNVSERIEVLALIQQTQPEVIYLPASLTNVDYCESHPDEAFLTNVTGVENVIQAANAVRAKLVYFSSDYIFDGMAGPYVENDTARPLSVYGRQKLLAEQAIRQRADTFLIIRTTVVYGWERQGKNFVYRMLRTLRNGQPLLVPSDQMGTPTYAPDLARAVLDLARVSTNDVFHVVGPDLLSRHDFSLAVAEVFGLDQNMVRPVLTADLGQAAPRPLKAGMIAAKAETILGRPLVGHRDGLTWLKEQEEHNGR